MLEMAKRDRLSAEERAEHEQQRAARAEDEVTQLRDALLEAGRLKEQYCARALQLDDAKLEVDRLRHVDLENGQLRD